MLPYAQPLAPLHTLPVRAAHQLVVGQLAPVAWMDTFLPPYPAEITLIWCPKWWA